MTSYDIWKESGPVDALTAAEAGDGRVPEDGPCWECGHDHAMKGGDRSYGDYMVAEPSHDDICDCVAKPRMVCGRCYGTPDDLCERYVCDDPRTP